MNITIVSSAICAAVSTASAFIVCERLKTLRFYWELTEGYDTIITAREKRLQAQIDELNKKIVRWA